MVALLRYHWLMVGLIFITLNGINAQSFLRSQGKEIVTEDGSPVLLRGMGLGGWMLQEGYMLQTADFANAQHKIEARIEDLIGKEGKDQFYDLWLSNHVTKADIDSLRSWGFNSVRLPMHYNLFTLPIEEEEMHGEHTWLEKGFELTDSLISWCAQNEMYVILDLHAAPGGQGRDEGISDYDPSKPSLWESKANRDKTVALWKKLAERYVNEPWVAGYDLLNEPNWELSGNRLLADLYKELTDTIRSIDQNHILFIEGNWFANDFTGLTPPWDDNMVYAPHKYWSINDQASIQWVLDLRDRYDIPLYLGESGENSNVWFRDAIRLLEDNNIGWAWWPMKKVESISGPLSIVKSDEYESLLNYWKGQGVKPSRESATSTLMQFAEDIRIENCVFQKDVIDAMFRQVYTDETIPFNTQMIPGVVYATDYDMGVIGSAYYDSEAANYNVSTGTYTAWNNGWIYRNDGVDIETCNDNVNSNGYNVGWINKDEWMQYDVGVEIDGTYDVKVRLAAGTSGGQFHFKSGSSDLIEPVLVTSSGGWQNWATLTVPNVVLHSTDKKITFYADEEGFNISSFEFIYQGPSTNVSTTFVSAITLDENTIQVNFNKAIDTPLPQNLNGLKLTVNGGEIEGFTPSIDENNGRILYIKVDDPLLFDDVMKVSYQGETIKSIDGTRLLPFLNELVKNTLTTHYNIPGKIEAEDYFFQSGIQLENTTDAGGGKNIGYLDVNDYLEYKVNIKQEGNYSISFRTASLSARGGLKLSLIDRDGEKLPIGSVRFDATGGWQNWSTESMEAELPVGRYTLLMEITHAPFNLNWMDFLLTDEPETSDSTYLKVFPVPSNGIINIEGQFRIPHNLTAQVYNNIGNLVLSERYGIQSTVREVINLDHFSGGLYYLRIELEDGTTYQYRLIKMDQ